MGEGAGRKRPHPMTRDVFKTIVRVKPNLTVPPMLNNITSFALERDIADYAQLLACNCRINNQSNTVKMIFFKNMKTKIT